MHRQKRIIVAGYDDLKFMTGPIDRKVSF